MPEYIEIRGRNHREAFQKVKERYGEDVHILDHGPIPHKDLWKRMIGQKEYYVRIAVPRRRGSSLPAERKEVSLEESLKALRELRQKIQATGEEKKLLKKEIPSTFSSSPSSLSFEQKILQELEKIKEKIEVLSSSQKPSSEILLEPSFREIYSFLERQFFSSMWIDEFISELKRRVPRAQWSLSQKVLEEAKILLQEKVLIHHQISGKRAFIFVGPTGVGKTTTIAKLASQYALQENKKVALITLDQYRIAAEEHLLGFAEILKVPLVAVKSPEVFLERLQNLPAEIILVDTPGYSPTNDDFLKIQKRFFSSLPKEVDKVLVLSATTKREDVEYTIEKFSQLEIQRSVLTKIDETSYFGFFIELVQKWEVPFFVFCDGQNVPNSLHEARGEYLVEKLFALF